jgi:hypothetical protein
MFVMGGNILFSVLVGGAALMGALAAMPPMKGWKAFFLPTLGVGAILLIWNLVSLRLPH